jgi:Holliday junction resolvasome RuvABC endonuclease subunit
VIIVGVDPGVTGGLACIRHGTLDNVQPMPVYNGRADGMAIDEMLTDWEPDAVYLEDTQPMPKNGSIASFSLGLNTGIVVGAVTANHFKLVRVKPQAWKKKMGLTGKDKNASRGLARELFPQFAEHFKLVKNDGLAEACLIARYGVFNEMSTHFEGEPA